MKAITLKRPWPHAVLHLGKRIENRSDKRGMPPMCRHRGWLLLHAGKGWDRDCWSWCDERGLLPTIDGLQYVATRYMREPRASREREGWHPTGIVGRCRVVGHIDGESEDVWVSRPGEPQSAEEVERAEALVPTLNLRWWMGGYGLILADVEALDRPIPCNGRLGLWTPKLDVLEQLPSGWREEA